MTGLEVTPTRGEGDSVFVFTITDAPLVEVARPPFRKENYAWLYVEAPDGTVVMRMITRKHSTVRFNPLQAWNGELPPPVIQGWERFLCFVYAGDDLAVPGADVAATPAASCVLILEPYTT